MPGCRLSIQLPALACVCCAAFGCITQETKDGSFTTGGPGPYGQPAPVSLTAETPPQKVVQADKDYVPTPKMKLALAQLQERRGFTEDSRKSYEQVLAIDAKSIDAVIGLARLDQIGGRTAEAEAGFQKALKMDPASGPALDSLGQFYIDQKRWNEGLAMLDRALATAPDDKSVRFHYAIALAKSGKIEQAVPHLVAAVGSAAAHYNIGVILHDRGELVASEDQFATAIIENPRLEQAQFWLKKVQRERDDQQYAGTIDSVGGVRTVGHRVSPVQDTRPVESRQSARPTDVVPAVGGSYDDPPSGQDRGPAAPTPRSSATRQPVAQPAGSGDFAPPQAAAPVSPLGRRNSDAPGAGPTPPADPWNSQQ